MAETTGTTVTLRTMTAAQFDDFLDGHAPQYVEQLVASGSTPEAARQKAADDLARLLPDGLRTPGQALFTAYAGDVPVGSLWLGFGDGSTVSAWLYYVVVHDDVRGRGYGRALMRAAEEECRRRGVASLGLNVHGSNTMARALYESMGYAVSAQQMYKPLG